jgi:alpha-mannosidase
MEHRYHEHVRGRLAQMSARLRALAHPEALPADRLLVSERAERIGWHAAQALTYRDVELGEAFGPQWATYWFRIAATIPEAWAGAVVELAWERQRGDAVARRRAAPGPQCGRDRAADRGPAHRGGGERRAGRGRRGDGVQLLDGRRQLEAEPALEPAWAGLLLAELNRFCAVWDGGDQAAAREILIALLAHGNAARVHRMTAIGHAHLDTAWLWPLAPPGEPTSSKIQESRCR